MSPRVLLWVGFNAAVLAVLALDLLVAHRQKHPVGTAAATFWTVLWISLSGALGAGIYVLWGHQAGLQFFTGYLIEYALSVDNLFVFLVLFQFFCIKPEVQHKVLLWGVLGAFVMRGALILTGSALLHRFAWLLYLFGGFLIFTAWKMVFGGGDGSSVNPDDNAVLKWARRVLPLAKGPAHGSFFLREEGKLRPTELFLVLLVVETTDLLFALDSIPAALGVSHDPFILYASNVCAVMGLRSLYFLLADLMRRLRYLQASLSVVLAFVGGKMILDPWVHIPIGWSLGVIGGVLLVAVLASLWASRGAPKEESVR